MLCGDYLTYEKRADQSGGSPHCRSCIIENKQTKEELPSENLIHILTICTSYSDIRKRILSELSLLCQKSKNSINFDKILEDKNKLCQFILDPTSMNLESRINFKDPLMPDFFRIARDMCYSIHTKRMNILKEKSQNK